MATTSSRSSSAKKRGTSSKSRNSRSRSRGSSNGSSESNQQEADRYRRAAEDALQQLDWAIGYLHGIKKTGISKALAQNRSYIRRNLMGRSEQPLPDQQTNET
ncbi:MAG TPA: hypothetical protein VH300_17280 [Thermoleophilaceae bacterium]|jgi:hypothetical protein|nr:hypothetical protein [Thermoleophilaceae bacterium]